MEARLISLDDFVYAGEGANGESYNHVTDKDLMLKLYFEQMDRANIEIEVQRAKDVYEAGIASPLPGDFVTDGHGRYGILFKRLVGKVSFARAAGENPEKIETLARDFARMCLKMHSTHVDTSKFPSVKQQYIKMLEDNTVCTPAEKAYLRNIILSAPDADTAIHGDMHFGNALMVGDEKYWIDLGEFACGYPFFDLGMMLLCCNWNDEGFIVENFHMSKAQAVEFFKYFADEYFGGTKTLEQAIEEITPYGLVKCILVERNGDFRFPILHDRLDAMSLPDPE